MEEFRPALEQKVNGHLQVRGEQYRVLDLPQHLHPDGCRIHLLNRLLVLDVAHLGILSLRDAALSSFELLFECRLGDIAKAATLDLDSRNELGQILWLPIWRGPWPQGENGGHVTRSWFRRFITKERTIGGEMLLSESSWLFGEFGCAVFPKCCSRSVFKLFSPTTVNSVAVLAVTFNCWTAPHVAPAYVHNPSLDKHIDAQQICDCMWILEQLPRDRVPRSIFRHQA